MIPSQILREQPKIFSAAFPYNLETNPYIAKKHWPPDFTKLSQKHQFRLERRFRRRSKLKYLRPGWMKGTKLVQWAACLSVLGYAVFYLDMRQDAPTKLPQHEDVPNTPFRIIRDWCADLVDSIWTHSSRHPERLHNHPLEKASPSGSR